MLRDAKEVNNMTPINIEGGGANSIKSSQHFFQWLQVAKITDLDSTKYYFRFNPFLKLYNEENMYFNYNVWGAFIYTCKWVRVL